MLQEDGHYTPFEKAFTMTRSEQDRPSLHGQKAAKAFSFSPSVQRVLNIKKQQSMVHFSLEIL